MNYFLRVWPPSQKTAPSNNLKCLFSTSQGCPASRNRPQVKIRITPFRFFLYESGEAPPFQKTIPNNIFMNVLFSTSLAAIPETSPE